MTLAIPPSAPPSSAIIPCPLAANAKVPNDNVPTPDQSPGPAKGPLAATAKTTVAIPSPGPAKGLLAATANAAVAISSPGPAKGLLAATAKGTVVVQSPGPANGLLAATAKGTVAVSAIASASPPGASPYRLRPDNLGKSALVSALLIESGMSFANVSARHHGDSCLANATLLPHSAAPILATLRSTGAPANLSSAPWTEAQHDAAAKHGPHKGTNEHIEFMRAEFFDMVNAGQWLVLPYQSVRHLPDLRISPTGVVYFL
jgi:hypothetical protein